MHSNKVSIVFLLLCIVDITFSIEFSQPFYVFYILENEPSGTMMGQVLATTTEPDELTYSISEYPDDYYDYYETTTDEIQEMFEINSEDGTLYAKVSLDREEIPYGTEIVFEVATSKDGDRSASTYITVYVKDLNDNAPHWIFPNNEDGNASNIFIAYNGSAGPIAEYGADACYIPYNAELVWSLRVCELRTMTLARTVD